MCSFVFVIMHAGGEVMERLTTLGITLNLVTYLTGTMHLGNAASANLVTNFVGTSFMLCLFGGFLADTYIGRFVCILTPCPLNYALCLYLFLFNYAAFYLAYFIQTCVTIRELLEFERFNSTIKISLKIALSL